MQLQMAMQAWNKMNGCIDWVGLEIVAELVGAVDIESLINHLQLIQDYLAEQK